jgi:AcrR family transcriptional regulator
MTAIDRQRQASRSLGPGREGLSGSEVNDFQRVRIVRAMVEVSAEVGYMGASLALVVTRARMSRRTFYELFEDRQDCFLAAFEWGVAQARAAIAAAAPTGRSWRERTRLGLAALLRLFDSEPALARVCVVESLGAGERVLRRRAETLG